MQYGYFFVVTNIKSVFEFFENNEALRLRKISDHFLAEGALEENHTLIRLSVVAHALSKILEKSYYKKKKSEWERFVKKIKTGLSELVENKDAINKIEAAIIELDECFGRYSDNILHISKVRKGSNLYAWGITLTYAAKLVGIDESEILSQSGQTRMVDEDGITINAEARLKNLEGMM